MCNGNEPITLGELFGTVEPVIYHKFEGGRRVTYSYSIKRNYDGVETSRTTPTKLSSMGFDGGTPLTQGYIDSLENRQP